MYERISYYIESLLCIAFTCFDLKPIFFCILANSSLRYLSQIMKLCGILLSNRRIKKQQNLNTNGGFVETMRFVVKFPDIYFVIFLLFIATKLWSSGSSNTIHT